VERLLAGPSASIAPHPVLVPEDPPGPGAISIYARSGKGGLVRVSCRVVSCRVVSCRVVSCRVVSCRVVSCTA
jgi:hypothetical protein